ncbi:MAG TPA: glycosyltransferase family 39 protein [Gaiellaceae bacterium]|nr:glycosyltransferase family 39 protein [Gaiellaceae bacterium]
MSTVAVGQRVDVLAGVRSRAWIVGWWAAGRAIVLATAAAMHLLGPRALAGDDERRSTFGVLASWDGRWYRTVAQNGYLLEPGRQSDPAFFPLYPALLRALHGLGLGYDTAGLLVSQIGFLAAIVALHALTRELLGARLARRTAIYLALFPVGFVFSMAYPESIVLCAIALTALAALRGRWIAAAVLAAVGTLARPETLFVALPLLPIAFREPRGTRRGIALGATAAPFAALGAFALYLQLTLHDSLAWTHAERAWGRRFTPLGVVRAFADLPRAVHGNAWVIRDLVFFLLYLGLLEVARRRGAPLGWTVAGALVVVLPTFSGSFHSVARFGLLAPALYWGLAALGEHRPRTDRAIRIASAVLLAAGTVSLAYVFP